MLGAGHQVWVGRDQPLRVRLQAQIQIPPPVFPSERADHMSILLLHISLLFRSSDEIPAYYRHLQTQPNIRAGFPAIKLKSGTSQVTTLPAPIMAKLPTSLPQMTVVLAPMLAPLLYQGSPPGLRENFGPRPSTHW